MSLIRFYISIIYILFIENRIWKSQSLEDTSSIPLHALYLGQQTLEKITFSFWNTSDWGHWRVSLQMCPQDCSHAHSS